MKSVDEWGPNERGEEDEMENGGRGKNRKMKKKKVVTIEKIWGFEMKKNGCEE